MTRRARYVRRGLALVAGGLIVLAVAAFGLALRYQNEISDTSRYNRTFDLSQTSAEILRLEMAITGALAHTPGFGPAETKLRYQIVVGRSKMLLNVGAAGYGPDASELTAIAGELRDGLAELGPLMERINEPAVAARAIALLHPLNTRFTRLGSMSHAQAGDAVIALQSKLLGVFVSLCAVIAALVVSGLALLALLFRQNARSEHHAHHDALTGIHNRFALNRRMDALKPSKAHAILLLDVDHFKDINDTLGHVQGDRFLVALSRRLTAVLGDADVFARLGGDEFAILFEGLYARRRARDCADRVIADFRRPL